MRYFTREVLESSIMTDYSKWDRYSAELSSEDEDEARKAKPRVTKLDQPSRIKLGSSPQDQPYSVFSEPELSAQSSAGAGGVGMGFQGSSNSSSGGGKGGSAEVDFEKDYVQCDGGKYRWRQTPQEVVLEIPLSAGMKARDLRITMEEKGDVGSNISVRQQGQEQALLRGKLQYPTAPQDIQECWQVCTSDAGCSKFVEITLQKRSPVPGAVQWWGGLLAGEEPVDLSTIPARLRQQQGQASGNSSFQDNWVKAHSMFREKMAKGGGLQPQAVVVVGADDAAGVAAGAASVAEIEIGR